MDTVSSDASRTRPACVLVVDDSATIRTIVTELLADHGYRVLEAKDGLQATRLYRDHREEIDAVILDQEMPVLGGHETAQVLHTLNPAVRVLLMSGGAGAAILAKEAGVGIQAFIRKPFKLADLLAQVERLISPARS